MYFFEPRVLGKMLAVGAGQVEVDSNKVLDTLAPVLNRLFAIRQANLALNLGLEWLSFERCCELADGRIVFDLDDFARRYLNKGAKLALLDEFGAELDRQTRVPVPDRRMRMNGHDFAALLAWYLDKSGLRRGSRGDDVAEMLRVTTEADWLTDHPFFKSLLARFGP
jgi:hypothetical protein